MRRFTIVAILIATVVVGGLPIAAGGTESVGLVDASQGRWYLRDPDTGGVSSFSYGNPGDLPISGDWNGDGTSTPGLYRQSDGFFYARNSNNVGTADNSCFAGDPADIPVVGDWDGDGDDNLGIYRPSEQRFYLYTITCTGPPMGAAQIALTFGNPGDKPVAGDWDGDGIDEIGLHRESTGFFYWRNTLDTGIASGEIFFGDPGDRFVSGDWGIIDGIDTPGVFRPSNSTFYFRHTLTQGVADRQVTWGDCSWLPVSGNLGVLAEAGSAPPVSCASTATTTSTTTTTIPTTRTTWTCEESEALWQCSGDIDRSSNGVATWVCGESAAGWLCAGDIDQSDDLQESWSCSSSFGSWSCIGDVDISTLSAEAWTCSSFLSLRRCSGYIDSSSPSLAKWECSGSLVSSWSCVGDVNRSQLGSESWACLRDRFNSSKWACKGDSLGPWAAALTTLYPMPAAWSP